MLSGWFESLWESWRLWSALGSAESKYLKSGHCLGLMPSLELDWCKHAKCRVTALAVMEDLEVFEDRVSQLDTGPPASAI
jgi:hypothetical protein